MDDLLPIGRGAYSPTDHNLSVWRTFAVTYNKLRPDDTVDAAALALLARAACFAPGEPLPEGLLLAAMDRRGEAIGNESLPGEETPAPVVSPHLVDDGLMRLRELGLLERIDDEIYRLHRLIGRFVAGELAKEMAAAREAVEEAIFDEAARQNRAGDPRALRLWDAHIRHVVDTAFEREDEQAARLCNEMGYYLQLRGDLAGARPYTERALAIWERVLGPEHPDTAGSLNNLGYLLQAMGDLEGARPYYERALDIRERVLGPEHPDTAASLNNLAFLCYDEGDLPAAADLMRRALAIWEKVLGPDHPNTRGSREGLGLIEGEMTSDE